MQNSSHGDLYLSLPFDPSFQVLSQVYTSEQVQPYELDWYNLDFKDKSKTLLKGVSGHAHPGQLTALLGPAKSGKTALLATLAGRVGPGEIGRQSLSGQVLVNGNAVSSVEMRHLSSAFVRRHDTVFRSDTVKQSLHFALALRCLNYKNKGLDENSLVNDLISSLGLKPNVQVANLSPRETKLLMIGIELTALPSFIFVDEPSAFLDVESSWIVIRTLKALAKLLNITVIVSMQQPSGETFAEFSAVCLMSKGQIVFQGPMDDMERSLAQLGFPLPAKTSPSDFMLLVARSPKIDVVLANRSSSSDQTAAESDVEKGNRHPALGPTSSFFPTKPEIQNFGILTFLGEVYVIAKREVRSAPRRFKTVIVICILSVILGLLFLNGAVQTSTSYSFTAEFAGLVLVSLASALTQSVSYGLSLAAERPVFIHERSSGLYSSTAYFLGKLLVELPVNFFFASVWFVIMYYLVGWQGRLIYFIAVDFFVLEICTSMVYMFTSLFDNATLGMGFVPAILAPQLLFMGTFVRVQSMTPVLQWVPNIVFLKYAVSLLSVEEFSTPCSPTNCETWNELMESDDFVAGDVWWYALVLGAFLAFFRVSGWLLLSYRARRASLTGMA